MIPHSKKNENKKIEKKIYKNALILRIEFNPGVTLLNV